MSIRDISAILKEEEARLQKNKHQQQQEETEDIITGGLDLVDMQH